MAMIFPGSPLDQYLAECANEDTELDRLRSMIVEEENIVPPPPPPPPILSLHPNQDFGVEVREETSPVQLHKPQAQFLHDLTEVFREMDNYSVWAYLFTCPKTASTGLLSPFLLALSTSMAFATMLFAVMISAGIPIWICWMTILFVALIGFSISRLFAKKIAPELRSKHLTTVESVIEGLRI